MSKTTAYNYFILVAQVLLAWTFMRYGYSKLTGGQFGLSEPELNTPIKDLSLFRIGWFLFDHEPFKTVVGILQIASAILLIFKRTVIIGALIFVPIGCVIVLIDLTIMPTGLSVPFAFRFGFYFLLIALILIHHKERIPIVWQTTTEKSNITKLSYPWYWYILLPVFTIVLEVIGAIPMAFVKFLAWL